MVEGTIRNKPERIELALPAVRPASEMWCHDDGSVTFEFPLAGLPSKTWSRVFDEVRRQQHDVSEARLELDGPTVCVRSRNTDLSLIHI